MADEGRRLFLSYTRADRDNVQSLLQSLRRLRYQVWLDDEISGGQEWWDTILGRIRSCDALILALSPAELDSEACYSEVLYAQAVNRPVLPVMVETVGTNLLPPEVARLNVVDFTGGPETAAFELIGAVNQLPPAGPLPDPLPAPPPVPISYLSELSRQVHSPGFLAFDDQVNLLGKLKLGLERPKERADVLELLRILRERRDCLATTATEIDRILADRHVGQRSEDGRWIWDGARWVAAEEPAPRRVPPPPQPPPPQPPKPPRPQPALDTPGTAAAAPMRPWGVAEIGTVLTMIFCGPVALVSVWFTRWSKTAKWSVFLVTGSLWLVFLLIARSSGG